MAHVTATTPPFNCQGPGVKRTFVLAKEYKWFLKDDIHDGNDEDDEDEDDDNNGDFYGTKSSIDHSGSDIDSKISSSGDMNEDSASFTTARKKDVSQERAMVMTRSRSILNKNMDSWQKRKQAHDRQRKIDNE